MKKSLFLLLFLISAFGTAYSQSAELKDALKEVNTTLKEYKYVSEDVDIHEVTGKTTDIVVSLKNGELVFNITDDYGDFSDPFYGFRHGVITVSVPVKEACFDSTVHALLITSKNPNGVLLVYDGKKELLKSYSICGTEGNIIKLRKELEKLLSLANR